MASRDPWDDIDPDTRRKFEEIKARDDARSETSSVVPESMQKLAAFRAGPGSTPLWLLSPQEIRELAQVRSGVPLHAVDGREHLLTSESDLSQEGFSTSRTFATPAGGDSIEVTSWGVFADELTLRTGSPVVAAIIDKLVQIEQHLHDSQVVTVPDETPKRFTISMPAETRTYLDEIAGLTRAKSAAVACTELIESHRDLMRLELARIPLTVSEATTIAMCLQGAAVRGVGPRLVYGEVADAIDLRRKRAGPGADPFYGIDEEALLRKLEDIGPSADLALREAIARYRRDADSDPSVLAPGEWRRAGLTIVDH